jgi:hypothetical protein
MPYFPHAFSIGFLLCVLFACSDRVPLPQADATAIAQREIKEYAETHKLESDKFAAPRVLYYKDPAVWEFFYSYSGEGLKGVNILVDNFRNAEIHETKSQN